jgi:hypothetical protein
VNWRSVRRSCDEKGAGKAREGRPCEEKRSPVVLVEVGSCLKRERDERARQAESQQSLEDAICPAFAKRVRQPERQRGQQQRVENEEVLVVT